MIQRRLIVLRAFDAVLPEGTEFESNMRCFADETVLIVPSPRVGPDLVKDLHPVLGDRRDRRAFDEGLEALFGGGVVAGVDFIGVQGRADGLEVGFDDHGLWRSRYVANKYTRREQQERQPERHNRNQNKKLPHAFPMPEGWILACSCLAAG